MVGKRNLDIKNTIIRPLDKLNSLGGSISRLNRIDGIPC